MTDTNTDAPAAVVDPDDDGDTAEDTSAATTAADDARHLAIIEKRGRQLSVPGHAYHVALAHQLAERAANP